MVLRQGLGGSRHPRLYTFWPPSSLSPYPKSFSDSSDGANTDVQSSVGSSTKVTFLAKAKSSDKNLVVNLVHRYGVEAYQLLADAGAAPWLLYCGSLDGKHDVGANGSRFKGSTKLCGLYVGPISMAVMEYIEGKTMDKITSLPNDTHERIQKAVSKLYGADLIFGDLRKPNIIVSDQKAFLIDFDWAGKESEEAYRRM